MKVWLLEILHTSGEHDVFHTTAFLDGDVAEMKADELEEEWVSYKPKEVEAEMWGGDRCIVDRRVYDLNTESAVEKNRHRGLAKLNVDERKALGLEP